jgi:hypothetical protein
MARTAPSRLRNDEKRRIEHLGELTLREIRKFPVKGTVALQLHDQYRRPVFLLCNLFPYLIVPFLRAMLPPNPPMSDGHKVKQHKIHPYHWRQTMTTHIYWVPPSWAIATY